MCPICNAGRIGRFRGPLSAQSRPRWRAAMCGCAASQGRMSRRVQWRRRMTTSQYTSFDTFVRATLSNGTSRFNMPVWLGASYVTKTVQIAKDFAFGLPGWPVRRGLDDAARLRGLIRAARNGSMGRGRSVGARIGAGLFYAGAAAPRVCRRVEQSRSRSGA